MDNKLENIEQDDLLSLDNLEIAPLSDDDLENVVGGLCSVWCCSKVAAVKQA